MAKSKATIQREARVNTAIGTATDTARAELGDADNRSVTVKSGLDVSVTEKGKTVSDGVAASVSLSTSHSETTEKGAKK